MQPPLAGLENVEQTDMGRVRDGILLWWDAIKPGAPCPDLADFLPFATVERGGWGEGSGEPLWIHPDVARINAEHKTDYDRDMNHQFFDLYPGGSDPRRFALIMGRMGNTSTRIIRIREE